MNLCVCVFFLFFFLTVWEFDFESGLSTLE